MLEEIRISGLGVIGDASLELGSGLTVITGETGAGKTMILQGLHLLLGGRSDSGVVRVGAPRASVDGTLLLSADSPARNLLDELEATVEDDRVILSRSVSSEGRSKAVVGGRVTPIASLAELAESFVVVHGQSDQIRLLKPGHQRDLLDRFGVDRTLTADFGTSFERWRDLGRRIAAMELDADLRAQRIDELREDVARIDAIAPQPGEFGQLEIDLNRLAHTESLHEAARVAHLALSGDPDTPEVASDAVSSIAIAGRALAGQQDRDPDLGALAGELEKAASIVGDVVAELSHYVDRVDADPQRLEALQQRKSALSGLIRRYGQTLEDVLEHAASARLELEEFGDASAITRLHEEYALATAECAARASRLRESRLAAATRLREATEAELRGLGMPSASLEIHVTTRSDAQGIEVDGTRVAVTASGIDDVDILLAPHPGAVARPLGKGASGGELSRVMLALEVALAGSDPVPTMVFDEVDAGVGGRAAIEVGARLAKLARDHQVICVTHLAQVAAFADHHVIVRKSNDGVVTSTDVSLITNDEQRLVELSRMLSGVDDSEMGQAHAGELRELALAQRKASA